MSDFYWELVQHDGTTLDIPPGDKVDIIKRRMEKGEPINTTNMVIPSNQIRYFRKGSKPYNPTPVLEEVAQAFKEPLITESGGVQSRWVKKAVTQREYVKSFSQVPAYRKLAEENGMVIVAFRLAVHDIDNSTTQPLTDEEVQSIENKH